INAAFSRNIKRLAQRRAELSGAPEKQNHSEKSDASLPKQARTPLDPHPEHPVLNLQQAIGNQAVMRLMQPQTGGAVGEHKALHDPPTPSSPAILQRKLTINEPGDTYEQEADRVADQVMRTSAPAAAAPSVVSASPVSSHAPVVQRQPTPDAGKEKPK